METTEEKRIIQRTVDNQFLKGIWRLKYKLVNRMGLGGFSGKMLTVYTDAVTGRSRYLYDLNGRQLTGYFIEKQVTTFNPEENLEDRNILDWLIGHPDVDVDREHAKVNDKYMSKKSGNARIELLNLDHQSIVHLEEEDYIDKLVGRIVLDSGVHAIGLEKIRFVLAKLQLPYMDERHIKNSSIEKPILQKKLKTYVRTSKENAQRVNAILDDLEDARFHYEIQEMLKHEILYVGGGMYKYDSQPLGVSTESVILYFKNNPDFYAELSARLTSIQKEFIRNK